MPIMLPDDDLDDLPPLSPRISNTSSGHHKRHRSSTSHSQPGLSGATLPLAKEKKRVKVYDASSDALVICDALAARQPNMDPLIEILPQLSHDQLLELRNEYKKVCKVQGHGINVAKHIKLKTGGNFGKVAYVTAL